VGALQFDEVAAAAWNLAEADLRVRPISGAALDFLLEQELRLLKRRRRLRSALLLLRWAADHEPG
jgi:hypothetical protein